MKGLNARWQTVAGPHARIEAAWETNRAFDAIAGEDDAKVRPSPPYLATVARCYDPV